MLNGYDISKTYTNFWGGISDDEFVGQENSVSDLDTIDIRSEERFSKADDYPVNVNIQSNYGGPMKWLKNTSFGDFRGNDSETLNPSGTQLSGVIGSPIDAMEASGGSSSQVCYFFHRTAGVKRTNFNGTVLTATDATGYPTANTPITATGWQQLNILFGKANILYFYSSVSNTTATAWTFPPGTAIKYIHSGTVDLAIVVTTIGNDTYIHELEFTGGAYNTINTYLVNGKTIYDCVGNLNDIFLAFNDGLYQYQGRQMIHVKYIELGPQTKLGYKNGVLICNGDSLYLYGSKKPGRNKSLTRTKLSGNIIDISGSSILVDLGSTSAILVSGGAYKRENKIFLRPLDGGAGNKRKQDLMISVGYIFSPGTYTNPATRQEVEILIQTDGMAMINSVNYISVGKVTDGATIDSLGNPRYGILEIPPQEVVKALETAGCPSSFQFVKIQIVIRAGDEYTSPTGYYRKTPKIYDVTLNSNFLTGSR